MNSLPKKALCPGGYSTPAFPRLCAPLYDVRRFRKGGGKVQSWGIINKTTLMDKGVRVLPAQRGSATQTFARPSTPGTSWTRHLSPHANILQKRVSRHITTAEMLPHTKASAPRTRTISLPPFTVKVTQSFHPLILDLSKDTSNTQQGRQRYWRPLCFLLQCSLSVTRHRSISTLGFHGLAPLFLLLTNLVKFASKGKGVSCALRSPNNRSPTRPSGPPETSSNADTLLVVGAMRSKD